MASRAASFVVLVGIAACVAKADHPLVPNNSTSSGGEVLLLEFPGQLAAYCGYHSHPEAAGAGPSVRFTVLQRGEDGRSVRDTYYCTLAGGEADFRQLAEDNILNVSRENVPGAEPALELGRVHCVLQPAHSVAAGIFDFRATRLSSGLPAFLCLSLDATRSLAVPLEKSAAPPERDALVFRFNRGNAPDLVCRSFSDVPLAESDTEVEIFGFLDPASGPLNCHFRPVYKDQPAAELLRRLSQQMRAQLVTRPGLPPTLTLPNFTCHAAMRADQLAVPAEVLSSSSSSSPAFTVTGPSSRWAPCWTSLEHTLEDVVVEFPNIPRMVCRSHEVPVSSSLDNNEFYFILQLGFSSRLRCRIDGLPKSEPVGQEVQLQKLLQKYSREMEATLKPEDGVPVLETAPATCVAPLASPAALPHGAPFVYSVRGKALHCVLAKREHAPARAVPPASEYID